MAGDYQFTSESVNEGHPDKVCDQIADAVLDSLLAQDPDSRVALECMITTGTVHVAGEITTAGFADVQKIARSVLQEVGYTNPDFGIDCFDAGVWVSIHEQSREIADGVSGAAGHPQGAGDQGIMFGYACDETPERMPLPIMLAHRLCMRLSQVRRDRLIPDLGPDGKSQVTVEYRKDRPTRVASVVVAQQHGRSLVESRLRQQIIDKVVKPVCGPLFDDGTRVHVNAAGTFTVGGPEADTGVTGRKVVADTYGGMARCGGGALSGKDPSKVDRSGTYMARAIAKTIVAAGLARRCEVQLAYVIGEPGPENLSIETFSTGSVDERKLEALVRGCFPLTPQEIIRALDLKRPIYRRTACFGHFGREEPQFTWERTDRAALLRAQAGL
ncbi:MAG TPA: methionine adenosyltransferase [Spirochaetia bacterium]|nr:methionine adenosyltransferase [Spirochaetia bacterium]